MTYVTAEQIRQKLENFRVLKQRLATECEKGDGKLPRHDMWRYGYYNSPYLAGARSSRIVTRFRDVFINLSELTEKGQITIPDGSIDDGGLMPKFTHLLEEWNSRGGVPVEVIAAAREPILRYFENGDPIGVRLFRAFVEPPAPFLVKYSRREFLEPMFRTGNIRICPASYYSDSKFIDSVRDSETAKNFFIPTFRERLLGKTSIEFQGHNIRFGDDDIVLPVIVPDYFLYSLSDRVYYRLPTDFDADAALIILDPAALFRRLISAFLDRRPAWDPFFGPVTYYDPYKDYEKCAVPEMAKHFGYSYQREVRISFRSKKPITGKLQPEFLNIGPMTNYAQLIAL